MVFTLDTDNKTIVLEGKVLLTEFIDHVTKILPQEVWKEYSIISKVISEVYPTYPIYPIYPTYPEIIYNSPGLPQPPWIVTC